jgi:Flp pilus assembly protein TadG
MPENKRAVGGLAFLMPIRQSGIASIEFALVAIFFLTLLFGIMELARIVYVFNTLQEVTRRAAALAASSDFNDDAVNSIRRQALFRDANDRLILADFVTPDHLKIEYLSVSRDGATSALAMVPATPLPSTPAQNYLNCLTSPYNANCVKLVRVSVCQPGGVGCDAVPYQMLFPMTHFVGLTLPRSTTIAPAQTLGRKPGDLPAL